MNMLRLRHLIPYCSFMKYMKNTLVFAAGAIFAMGGTAMAMIVSPPTPKIFSDVVKGSYYEDSVKSLTSLGVINGYSDDTFRPSLGLNRAEAAVIFDRYDTNVVEKLDADLSNKILQNYGTMATLLCATLKKDTIPNKALYEGMGDITPEQYKSALFSLCGPKPA